MPEESYHSPGHDPYGEHNPYSGMNGGPGSIHSSKVSLHSNSSNRPRQVGTRLVPRLVNSPGHDPYGEHNPYSGMNGGPGSIHSSKVSLHSNSSNRPRQVGTQPGAQPLWRT